VARRIKACENSSRRELRDRKEAGDAGAVGYRRHLDRVRR
jgi:hypothetical protein